MPSFAFFVGVFNFYGRVGDAVTDFEASASALFELLWILAPLVSAKTQLLSRICAGFDVWSVIRASAVA